MKDSIIKNTGNSRYLKSAISAATTWEQFRAALIAGTLPIDLNGINTAGWQQVGDALNKSNLLSDATVAALNAFLTSALPANPKVTDALKSLATVGLGKIAYGSYIGTGTYGSSNPCRLTFNFVPLLLIVVPMKTGINSYEITAFPSAGWYWLKHAFSTDTSVKVIDGMELSGATVSWHGSGSSTQANMTGITYKYLALG